MKPTDTSKEDPFFGVPPPAVVDASAIIEAQERQGQRELVQSNDLPTDGSDDPVWAALGVTFGEPYPEDKMFRPATLPAGWKKARTDHSMWSKVVDARGRERVAIFYKAAFYDRAAYMRPVPRFKVQQDYSQSERVRATRLIYNVLDSDRVVFRIVRAVPDRRINDLSHYKAEQEAQPEMVAECYKWLDERYPKWRDITAHWDDPDVPTIENLTVETDAPCQYRFVEPHDSSYDKPTHYRLAVHEDGKSIHEESAPLPLGREEILYFDCYGNNSFRRVDGRKRQPSRLIAETKRVAAQVRAACEEWLDQNRPGWRACLVRADG